MLNALELADKLEHDGFGCTCHAYGANECGCGASWAEHYTKDAASELRRLHEETEELKHDLKIAIEAQRCECSTEDACRFARERDANAKDAVRYQVLRNKLHESPIGVFEWTDNRRVWLAMEELDEAIDKVLAKVEK